MKATQILVKLGIALAFAVVGIVLTGSTVFSWLLALLIFYLEIRHMR